VPGATSRDAELDLRCLEGGWEKPIAPPVATQAPIPGLPPVRKEGQGFEVRPGTAEGLTIEYKPIAEEPTGSTDGH
jgi:hypothetical protein